MKVISIDPGYDRCGIAVLEKKEGKEQVLFSECFQTNKQEKLHQRIFSIGEEVDRVIRKYKPDALAIEDVFFSKNAKTALDVSQARGVIIYQGVKNSLEVYEFTPNQIKVAVTGYGAANKNDVYRMVERLVSLEGRKYIDDEIDAIAAGLTFLASHRSLS